MGISKFHNFVGIITESFRVDNEAIEELRVILEQQNEREIKYDEAEQIGRSLITVLETLANGRTITISKDELGGK
jgi:hypothetical protein